MKGIDSLKTFATERLDPMGDNDFYAVIPKLQLKPFSSLGKSKRGPGTTTVLKSTRELFGGLLVVGQSREVSLNNVLKYPLGPLPLSIATPDSSLVKTVRSKLLKVGEETPPLANTRVGCAVIVDDMAVLHSLDISTNITYSQLAGHILDSILRGTADSGKTGLLIHIQRYP